MTALRIAAFVVPLGLDTFVVAIALGLRGLRPLGPAVLFALFETAMPVVGYVLGRHVGRLVEAGAVYAGAAILVSLGIHSLRKAQEGGDEAASLSFGSVRGAALAGLAVSTDEIAVGFPLGALGLPAGAVFVAIGVQAFVVTVAGIEIGRRIGAAMGVRASRAAGVAAGIAFVLLGCYLAAERLVGTSTSGQ